MSDSSEPTAIEELPRRIRVEIPFDPAPQATHANQATATFSADEVLVTFAQAFLPPRFPGQAPPEALARGVIDAHVVTHIVMPLNAFVNMADAFATLANRVRELGLARLQEEDETSAGN